MFEVIAVRIPDAMRVRSYEVRVISLIAEVCFKCILEDSWMENSSNGVQSPRLRLLDCERVLSARQNHEPSRGFP